MVKKGGSRCSFEVGRFSLIFWLFSWFSGCKPGSFHLGALRIGSCSLRVPARQLCLLSWTRPHSEQTLMKQQKSMAQGWVLRAQRAKATGYFLGSNAVVPLPEGGLTPVAKGSLCCVVTLLICPDMQEITCFTYPAPQSNEFSGIQTLKVSRNPLRSHLNPFSMTQIGALLSRRKVGNSVRVRGQQGHSLFLDSI